MQDNTTEIDTDHPVFAAFRLAGYSADDLTDPGHVTPEAIESGGWRVVKWGSHGVTFHDVDGDDLTDPEWSPAGVAVEYGRGVEQPIAFAGDDHEPLNADIRSMTQLRGMSDQSVVFFAGPDADREAPEYDPEEAIKALGFWGSEGYVPRESVEALGEAFDAEWGDSAYKEDPDADGVELMRAPHVAKHLAAVALGTAEHEDSTTIGHKKRRRTEFHDNLDALADAYGVDLN